jgi:hypothetical protein
MTNILEIAKKLSEIIDLLGGWSLKSVGQGYGKGYNLSVLNKWLLKIKL